MRSELQLLALLCYMLTGCQIPVEVAGEEHRTAIEKWQALARYAESSLISRDVGITAQLSLVSEKGFLSYKLTNIKLSKTETHFNVNLLVPFFKDKYICTPICEQLLEYVPVSPNAGYTLLSQYFDRHEYELFEFYGDIYKLNEKLVELEAVEPSRVPDFLDYIATEKTSHESLRAFSGYISKQLSIAGYIDFLSNPPLPVSQAKTYAWYSETFKLNGSQEPDNWSSTPANVESALWSTSGEKESEKWQIVGSEDESKAWHMLESETSMIAGAKFVGKGAAVNSEQVWLYAKNTVIDLDDLVCTYNDNRFGRVVRVTDNQITVALMGQAKMVKDGLVIDPASGFLFSGKGEVSFMPLKGQKQLSHRELAVCYAE